MRNAWEGIEPENRMPQHIIRLPVGISFVISWLYHIRIFEHDIQMHSRTTILPTVLEMRVVQGAVHSVQEGINDINLLSETRKRRSLEPLKLNKMCILYYHYIP